MTTTPGPWTVSANAADGSPLTVETYRRVIGAREYDEVCVCYGGHAAANARLVAAAPELLAALQEQRRQMDYPDLPPAFAATMKRMLDAAIAKVTTPSNVGSAPLAAVEGNPQGASNPESALGRFALNLPPELP